MSVLAGKYVYKAFQAVTKRVLFFRIAYVAFLYSRPNTWKTHLCKLLSVKAGII